jgi:hypothetical protein
MLVSRSDAGPAEEEGRAYGATVAKRRLSRRLAAMRVRAGFSANEVGDKLNWSRGRLQRMEGNQWRLPEPDGALRKSPSVLAGVPHLVDS